MRRNSATVCLVLAALSLLSCKRKEQPAATPKKSRLASARHRSKIAPKREPRLTSAERAAALAKRFIIVDGHIDVPYRLKSSLAKDGRPTEDVSRRTVKGDFDYPRAKKGGLDAPFFSIYVPARYEKKGARKLADSLIDLVEGIARRSPDRFTIVRSVSEVRTAFGAGRIGLALGMENGAPIEGKLANLRHFYRRGIRYITLAHSQDNHLADSSYDDRHLNKGLSTFGRRVVREMNRLGIIVDVSHLSDQAFWDVLKHSQAPPFASHSSCRHFTPKWKRNLSDDMIKALAKKGGVVLVNFGSGFLDGKIQKADSAFYRKAGALLKKKGLKWGDAKAKPILAKLRASRVKRFTTVERVADHIEHVIRLTSVRHVGFGSDFDGVGDSLPSGLKDVSQYPNLIRVLLERGHTEADIRKICGENALRVWSAVEAHARRAGRGASGR